MEKQVTQILVGPFKVGIVGLFDAFAEVRRVAPPDDKSCQEELLNRIKADNTVTEGAEATYKKALWHEYRRWSGDRIEPGEAAGLRIEVLGPGCYACDKLIEDVREVLAGLEVEASLEHVRDLRQIAGYGLLPTPALVINGEVKCSGNRPSKKQLEALIHAANP